MAATAYVTFKMAAVAYVAFQRWLPLVTSRSSL
jgi:hypothetical protein